MDMIKWQKSGSKGSNEQMETLAESTTLKQRVTMNVYDTKKSAEHRM